VIEEDYGNQKPSSFSKLAFPNRTKIYSKTQSRGWKVIVRSLSFFLVKFEETRLASRILMNLTGRVRCKLARLVHEYPWVFGDDSLPCHGRERTAVQTATPPCLQVTSNRMPETWAALEGFEQCFGQWPGRKHAPPQRAGQES
jgi:hypothetical protein